MKTVEVLIDSFEKAEEFTSILNEYPCDFDLLTGCCVIDAKSIMGIFHLDISKPLNLNIRNAGSQISEILEALQPFLVTKDE